MASVQKLPEPSSLSERLYAEAMPYDQPSDSSGRMRGAVGSGLVVPKANAASAVDEFRTSYAASAITGSGSFTVMVRDAVFVSEFESLMRSCALESPSEEANASSSETVLRASPMPSVELSTSWDATAGSRVMTVNPAATRATTATAMNTAANACLLPRFSAIRATRPPMFKMCAAQTSCGESRWKAHTC